MTYADANKVQINIDLKINTDLGYLNTLLAANDITRADTGTHHKNTVQYLLIFGSEVFIFQILAK